MRGLHWVLAAAIAGVAIQSGCSSVDKTPPPPRVAIPPADDARASTVEPLESKPRPPQPRPDAFPPPPFDDVPLVMQHPPEERAFVEAYSHVGKPRILLFVNRTLEGEVMPVNTPDPVVSVQRRSSSSNGTPGGSRSSERTTEVYLHPGQYDEAQAKSLDYEAVETILTDWLSADGRVAIVSPVMARQRLTAEQIRDMQSGRPRVLSEVARQLDADVLVQATAHPTRQTERGLEIRVIAEAINIKGGESIGRAVVDVEPPLDKLQINKYTRFLARKLMDGMTGSWESFGAPPPPGARAPEEVPVLPPADPAPQPMPSPAPPPPAAKPPVPNPLATQPGADAQPREGDVIPLPPANPPAPAEPAPTTKSGDSAAAQ